MANSIGIFNNKQVKIELLSLHHFKKHLITNRVCHCLIERKAFQSSNVYIKLDTRFLISLTTADGRAFPV